MPNNKAFSLIGQTNTPKDIHLYIDTSGSLNSINYDTIVKMFICLAKTLNVNLYFNSFSHILSQATKLETKNKSIQQMYKQYLKTPKICGSTNYELVWNYINKSTKRKNALNFIITDFEYAYIPQTKRNIGNIHPKNLYYIPCDNIPHEQIYQSSKLFAESVMEHNTSKRFNINHQILL